MESRPSTKLHSNKRRTWGDQLGWVQDGMNEADLRSVVDAVRTRLESADLSQAHPCFRSFPRGACGATCDVLAAVLEYRFDVKPQWVGADIGEGADWSSHVWLEVEDFTIDITADQFGREPVIVAKRSGWHDTLAVTYRNYFPIEERNWGEVGSSVWHLVGDLASPIKEVSLRARGSDA